MLFLRLPPGLVVGHVEVLGTGLPLLVDLHQERTDQPQRGVAMGIDPNHAVAPADFLVQAFPPVGGAQPLAVPFRQDEHGRDVVKGVVEQLQGFGRFVSIGRHHVVPQQPSRLEVGGIQNGPDLLDDRVLPGLPRRVPEIAQKVGLVPLPRGPLKLRVHGLDEPPMVVRYHEIHPLEPHRRSICHRS